METFHFKRGFASDNNAGVHPAVLEAVAAVNNGHCLAYGHDPVTRAAEEKFCALFGQKVEVFFVFNGTGANVLALASALRSHQAVICSHLAHLHVDECGAPEKFIGSKLLPLPTPDGKLTPAIAEKALGGRGDEHRVQPAALSVSQSTELGTIYTPDEIAALAAFARENKLLFHIDGARIANALATLDVPVAQAVAGADVVVFGGAKNGLLCGEAVVFLDTELANDFLYLRKQAMQLSAKMRFISAQFLTLLENDLWLNNARRANAMARRLADGLSAVPEIQITQPTQANGVFAIFPRAWIEILQEESFFYVWNETANEVRLMCSFDTREEDVDNFIESLRRLRNKQ